MPDPSDIEVIVRVPALGRIDQLMATVEELNQKVDTLVSGVQQLAADVDAARQRIDEDFQAIKDQLAQAGIDQAVVNEISAKLDSSSGALSAIDTSVAGIDPDPDNPAPDPTVEPTP